MPQSEGEKLFESKKIVTILLALLLVATVQSTKCNLVACINLAQVGQTSTPQSFRLLAVEATAGDNIRLKSGQLLIKALLKYINWNNETDQYTSYIHLLSRLTPDNRWMEEECKPFWRGNSTKANIRNEIVNFLGSAGPNEIVIFYYCGHGGINTLNPDKRISATELNSWLRSGGLPEAYVCVIFDACHSGSWINDGAGSSFGRGKMVLCSCKSDQISWGWPGEVGWSVFTGREKTTFELFKPKRPLGVVGGIVAANDTNRDGWLSFSEDFAFAKPSTEEYQSIWGEEPQNPVSYNGLEFDPYFVRLIFPVVSFTYSPSTLIVNQTITFNATASYSENGNITSYEWDFGDGNTTTIKDPIITHKYTASGNYSVTLNITDNRNLSNTTTVNINVREFLETDLNKDGIVNIIDISIVAKAYQAVYNETDGLYWHDPPCDYCPHTKDADLNDDKVLNIVDIATVAKDFGKTT